MTNKQARELFYQMNLSKVPSDWKVELESIRDLTDDFAVSETEASGQYANLQFIYDEMKASYPEVFKAATPKPAPAPKPAAPKAPAKPKAKAPAKPKPAPKPKVAKAPKQKPAPKPKVAKAPKPKAAPKPKPAPKPRVKKAVKPKASSAERETAKKREMLKNLNEQNRKFRLQLKDNADMRLRIAREAEKQMKEIATLGRTTLDVELEKAKVQNKLYKRFLSDDKGKFKRIKANAVGKLAGDLGKPKSRKKAKAKKNAPTRTKKSGLVNILDKAERFIFG